MKIWTHTRLAILALLLAACGGSGSDTPDAIPDSASETVREVCDVFVDAECLRAERCDGAPYNGCWPLTYMSCCGAEAEIPCEAVTPIAVETAEVCRGNATAASCSGPPNIAECVQVCVALGMFNLDLCQ